MQSVTANRQQDSSNSLQTATTIAIDDGSPHAFRGCTYPGAHNYQEAATIDDGSCRFTGCMDPNATNYCPAATTPDQGMCAPDVVPGCMDPELHGPCALYRYTYSSREFLTREF